MVRASPELPGTLPLAAGVPVGSIGQSIGRHSKQSPRTTAVRFIGRTPTLWYLQSPISSPNRTDLYAVTLSEVFAIFRSFIAFHVSHLRFRASRFHVTLTAISPHRTVGC